mmetsp:Transcript_26753/g.92329  ORF Transcript_26753/g.92329 Transcript_26753/m.92329 type:complete len:256 (+) Transcript_26753:80-847(+)
MAAGSLDARNLDAGALGHFVLGISLGFGQIERVDVDLRKRPAALGLRQVAGVDDQRRPDLVRKGRELRRRQQQVRRQRQAPAPVLPQVERRVCRRRRKERVERPLLEQVRGEPGDARQLRQLAVCVYGAIRGELVLGEMEQDVSSRRREDDFVDREDARIRHAQHRRGHLQAPQRQLRVPRRHDAAGAALDVVERRLRVYEFAHRVARRREHDKLCGQLGIQQVLDGPRYFDDEERVHVHGLSLAVLGYGDVVFF